MLRLFKHVDRIYDYYIIVEEMLILNLLWIVCSLPVITGGGATAALLYAMHEKANQNGTSAGKLFFEGFRRHFLKHTVFHLITLIMGALCVFNLVSVGFQSVDKLILFVINSWGLMTLVLISMHFYHLDIMFEMSFLAGIRLSILLAIKYLPKTIMMITLTIANLVIIYHIPWFTLCAFSIIAYFNVSLWRRLEFIKKEPTV